MRGAAKTKTKMNRKENFTIQRYRSANCFHIKIQNFEKACYKKVHKSFIETVVNLKKGLCDM